MSNSRRAQTLRSDSIGILLSAACFVHCVLTPFVLSFSPVLAHHIPGEERVHRFLAISIALIGSFAVFQGYRRHRRIRVVILLTTGLLLVFAGAYWGDRLPSHISEVAVTVAGSCLMMTAHFFNHTFCKGCTRCN